MAADYLVDDPLLQRLAPELDPLTTPYWTGGADGRLLISRCPACGTYTHPPVAHCPACLSHGVTAVPVSGRGTVLTYTVNYQQWIPGQEPFVIAIVGLEEQQDVRISTVLVGVAPHEARVGLPVEVRFVHRNDVYYPVFVRREDGGTAR
ncbi:Zn-ribbon domain-containing OB-fold protein [Dactylosporangium sucinum]|uniref:DNA-binding protein n=1 Tax=Dactylosporangium sucinum TaxID=1424081 RepID=A0A917U7M6_9ACTN|nr:Zn-ribbon domain-containing OB-fold protein [Dactylosporangium sucinum]GGM64481.1 hypothetical protein GCM10007977_077440 [Dactylosporangium sucinum]